MERGYRLKRIKFEYPKGGTLEVTMTKKSPPDTDLFKSIFSDDLRGLEKSIKSAISFREIYEQLNSLYRRDENKIAKSRIAKEQM